MTPDRRTVADAKRDPVAFARHLIGEPLWDHQGEVVRSKARIRCIASGRQAGKSRTLAVLALHEAFTVPGSLTLLVSAGEQASKDLLAVVSALAQAPLLGGSVVDDTKADRDANQRLKGPLSARYCPPDPRPGGSTCSSSTRPASSRPTSGRLLATPSSPARAAGSWLARRRTVARMASSLSPTGQGCRPRG
jgi:hypothetical protein